MRVERKGTLSLSLSLSLSFSLTSPVFLARAGGSYFHCFRTERVRRVGLVMHALNVHFQAKPQNQNQIDQGMHASVSTRHCMRSNLER